MAPPTPPCVLPDTDYRLPPLQRWEYISAVLSLLDFINASQPQAKETGNGEVAGITGRET